MRTAMLRDLAAHKQRVAMTLVAIALGVAATVAAWIAGDSIPAALVSDEGNAGVDVSVRGELSRERTEALAELPDVDSATTVVALRAGIVGGDGKLVATVSPFDVAGTGWDDTGRFALDAGGAPHGSGQVALNAADAERAGLAPGDEAELLLADGKRAEVDVTGLYRYRALGRAAEDPTPAIAFGATGGLPSEVVRVDLSTAEADAVATAAAKVVGSRAEVRDGEELAAVTKRAAESTLADLRALLLPLAGLALLVGMFIIANTFAMLVAQRSRQLALLRAVGALRGQVRRVMLLEALVLSAVGGTVGVLAGVALGPALLAVMSDTEVTYVVSPTGIVIGYAAAAVVTVLAALGAARRAASVPPLAALRGDVPGRPAGAGDKRPADTARPAAGTRTTTRTGNTDQAKPGTEADKMRPAVRNRIAAGTGNTDQAQPGTETDTAQPAPRTRTTIGTGDTGRVEPGAEAAAARPAVAGATASDAAPRARAVDRLSAATDRGQASDNAPPAHAVNHRSAATGRGRVSEAARRLRRRIAARPSVWGGVALLLVSVAVIAATASPSAGTPQRVAALSAAATATVATLLLAPALLSLVLRALGRTRLGRGPATRLALGQALADPRRASGTAVAVAIGMVLVCAFATLNSTLADLIASTIRSTIPATTTVVQAAGGGDASLTQAEVDAVADTDGVTEAVASADAVATLEYDGGHARRNVSAVPPTALGTVLTPEVTDGTVDLRDGFVVARNQADTLGLAVGDTVTIRFDDGTKVTDTVAGVYEATEYSASLYVAAHDVPAGQRDRVKAVYATGTDARAALERTFADRPDVRVTDAEGLVADVLHQQRLAFVIFYVMFALSLLIALFGVVNTLTLSVMERAREIGVLRAIGAPARLVRRMVRVESLVVAGFGAVLGAATGVGVGTVMQQSMLGQPLGNVSVPVPTLALALVAAAVAAVAAAVWPARRAARADVLTAVAAD